MRWDRGVERLKNRAIIKLDVVYFEEHGIPTANISTTEFMAAARVQCKNLGIPTYEVVTVPHPDRATDEGRSVVTG